MGMDEIGKDEILKLKRKKHKSRLLGLQLSLSEEEQNILKECGSEHPTELKTNSVSSIVSFSDDGVIHVPLYRPVELITKSIDDDTKKYHEEMKEHDELLNKKREELRQKIKRGEHIEIVEEKNDSDALPKTSKEFTKIGTDNDYIKSLSGDEKLKALRERLKQHITYPRPSVPRLATGRNRYKSTTDFLNTISIIRSFLGSGEFYRNKLEHFPIYAYMELFDQLFLNNKNKRFDCIYRDSKICGDTYQGVLICVRDNWIRLSEYLSYNPNEEKDGWIPNYQAPIEEHLAFNHMEYPMTEMGCFQYLYFMLEGHNMNKTTIVWRKSQVKEWYDEHAEYMITEKERKIIDELCLEPKIEKVEDGFTIDILMFCYEKRLSSNQYYETNGIKLPIVSHSSRLVRNKYSVISNRETKMLSSEVVINFTCTNEDIDKNIYLKCLLHNDVAAGHTRI